jgi:hypothetical protein
MENTNPLQVTTHCPTSKESARKSSKRGQSFSRGSFSGTLGLCNVTVYAMLSLVESGSIFLFEGSAITFSSQ